MYSRFTPGPDGMYQRRQMNSAPPKPREVPQAAPPAPSATPAPSPTPQLPAPLPPQSLKQRLSGLLPKSMELGDVLVLLIALLLLIDGEDDLQTILITAAAFFLL